MTTRNSLPLKSEFSHSLIIKTKIIDKLTIVFISDIHYGNNRIPDTKIDAMVRTALIKSKCYIWADMIIIGGDITDKYVGMGSETCSIVTRTFTELLLLSAKHKTKVIILEGTTSHDRNQASVIEAFYESHNKVEERKIDFEYIKDLEIRNYPDLGINMLFIPDEITHCFDETKRQVKELLGKKGLDKVDISVIHGMMDFCIPNNLDLPAHDTKFYSSITTHYVLCGHIHNRSYYKNVIMNGSPEAMHFGEEDSDKGHHVITCDLLDPSKSAFEFIKNKDQTEFVRFITDEISEEDIYKKLDMMLPGSWVEFQYKDIVPSVAKIAKDMYVELNVVFKKKKQNKGPLTLRKSKSNIAVSVKPLNKNTMNTMLADRLEGNGESKEDIACALECLEELQT